MARLIDGTMIAQKVRAEVAQGVLKLSEVKPGLATVLVGDDPASQAYVSSKQKACAQVGITSFGRHLSATASQAEVEAAVRELGQDPAVHGILVQLPLPAHLNEEAVLSCVPLEKDVDGFHPINLGRLAMKGREPLFVPCTPAGCIRLLQETGVQLAGAEAVVVGRSNIVGMPAALLLVRQDATVTIVHSRTRSMAEAIRRADVLVVAIGKPRFVTREMVKPGAVVIDVGINRISDPSSPRGSRLVGDVDFEGVSQVAEAITPVPGGVGPMTIAMLLQNTLTAARHAVTLAPSSTTSVVDK
ncbi:bifunctional methylenetetrahydrofolate dehydrogenase/methenyltetrahydrofolate cyclohydrolase FolD [bacterium CPR1]|nr:bifunctional methylenetetrahydrofolate dehydrogenase/methenyltetrahydrofolate cyclohydrolase FolD [bacterium CPR1]